MMCKFDEFMNNEVKTDSTKKAYMIMFSKLSEVEINLNKKCEDINTYDDFETLLNLCCKSKTYNSAMVKFSLIKKYFNFIGNKNINDVSKDRLKNIIIDDTKMEEKKRYISKEELIPILSTLENNSDKCIVMLLRNGIGIEYEAHDLVNLTIHDIDINNNRVGNKYVDDYTINLVKDTINETEYISSHSYNKVIQYNNGSSYLFKTRPTKYTNFGLTPFKVSGIRGRLQRIRKMLNEDSRIILSNLILSYVVDEVVKYQKELNRELKQYELKEFLNVKFGITKNIFDVRTMVREYENNDIKLNQEINI